jgi:hypothetical protein
MLDEAVLAQLKTIGYYELDEAFVAALWTSLDPSEKIQLITRIPHQLVLDAASRDESEFVRYWSIRQAGHGRSAAIGAESFVRLRSDASKLVSRRAEVWSYDDIGTASLPAVEAFLSGATWTETRHLPKVIESLVSSSPVDWNRVSAILHAFLQATDVKEALESAGPHNAFLVSPTQDALEYLKKLILASPEHVATCCAMDMPMAFHSFSLLEGWQAFPAKILAHIAQYRRHPKIHEVLLQPLRATSLTDPKLIELKELLASEDDSWEFENNSWATPATNQ